MSARLARAAAGPIALASRNRGKLAELQSLAGSALDLRLLPAEPPPPEVAEDRRSYLGNALAKARAIARFTGAPALADDSGLEVDALGGAPGVRSARYGGPELDDRGRTAHLLAALADVRARRARFRCVLVLADADGDGARDLAETGGAADVDGSSEVADEDGRPGFGLASGAGWLAVEGVLEGEIALEARGARGFGYDPVFVVPSLGGRTLGEVAAEEKARLSHRAAAMRALLAALGIDAARDAG